MSYFKLKEIEYFTRKVKVLCQNKNGPCPLLSLCNVLILNGKINIHPDYEQVSLDMITQLIANELLEEGHEKESSDGLDPSQAAEMKVMLQERRGVALSLLPSLQCGLDVNVKFNDVSSFEYTPELDCFDSFSVPLYHGWLYDPQDNKTRDVIKDSSYNHLQFKLVQANDLPMQDEVFNENVEVSGELVNEAVSDGGQEAKHTESSDRKEDSVTCQELRINNEKLRYEAKVIEDFLSETASQLTYAGLLSLHEALKEGSLCTFFRNNHFSTMLKRENSLYLLVTDLGYANMSNVVWELLDEIDGNTELVDSYFRPSNNSSQSAGSAIVQPAAKHLIDPDYLLALQLSEQQQHVQESLSQHQQPVGTVGFALPPSPVPTSQLQSQPQQLKVSSPQHSEAENNEVETENGIPVTISPCKTNCPMSSLMPLPVPSDCVGHISSDDGVFNDSSAQFERDHQAALDLQTAMDLDEEARRQACTMAASTDIHHLQHSMTPSELQAYREAELDYFRNDKNGKRPSSRPKKEDSGAQSGCHIA